MRWIPVLLEALRVRQSVQCYNNRPGDVLSRFNVGRKPTPVRSAPGC
jgi:hypothetical protein